MPWTSRRRWLISGVVAISVGLVVWWTALVLVPMGIVLLVLGMSKYVARSLEIGIEPRCIPINSSADYRSDSTRSGRHLALPP
jgi:hypothetical protein